MPNTAAAPGASPEAIQHHYDVGNDFYRLWLDPTMSYSCALWEDGEADDQLEAAQRRKIGYHAHWAHAPAGGRVLDVGCGWGAVLKHLVEERGVRQAVGLTLSRRQADWIAASAPPGVEIHLQSWADHAPGRGYDSIISIGAFEHFGPAGGDDKAKVSAYRAFFERCHDWLKPDGWLSLQSIAYGNVDLRQARSSPYAEFIEREIFPESELPTLEQITRACDGLLELVMLRNDRLDYARTCQVWADRLKARRREAEAAAGKAVFTRYMRYLKMCAALFHYGHVCLLRIAFRRLDEPRR